MAGHTACDYCSYKAVCGFDTGLKGFDYKNLRVLEKEEIFERMRKGGQGEDGREEDRRDKEK